jgi:hypothetical protein
MGEVGDPSATQDLHASSEIAETMGYANESTPRRMVAAALEDTYRENADIVRHLELRRIGPLWKAGWPGVVAEPPSLKAKDRLLKLMERRA